jgi:NADPH:quinone reductase-like Zn-dependent oxidoreductase
MRAIQAFSYGGPGVLQLVELPTPLAGPGEVLVRLAAAGANPVDWVARAGELAGLFDSGPWIWGWDIAGTVEAVGAQVTRFAVGDEVFGMPTFPALVKAYAEYVAVPVEHLRAKPPSLTMHQAAGLPLAGLTALQVLDLAGVQAGQRVLITAAAGGVGHLAVQIAKARGAHVIGTARATNHEFLRSIGVDEPIDYTSVDVATSVRDIDMVFDIIGEDALLATLRTGGQLVKITDGITDGFAAAATAAGVTVARHVVQPSGTGLDRLAQHSDAGELRVEIADVIPLEDAAKAHQLLHTGRVRGKIVLSM